MYLDNDKINDFLGTGNVNADGDTLSAFLEKYDPNKYQNPCNTVDTLIFTYKENDNNKTISGVLLIKRKNHPSIGWWALPGGFVDFREDIQVAALRELREETGVENVEVCELGCFGAYDRDPRTRIITTAYVGLVREGEISACAGDDASDAQWFEIKDEIIGEDESKDYLKEIHRLTLAGKNDGKIVGCEVEITTKKDTILPMINYKVVSRDELASDHGAIILQGYHYVLKCMEE